MVKIIRLLTVSAIALLAFNASTQAQTNRQEFPTLNAQLQFNDTTINVSSGVRFVNNLISDKALAAMDEEERKLGYASLYEYIYLQKHR